MLTLEAGKEKLLNFYRHHRRMPSYAEIMGICSFNSKNAAYKLVAKLIASGIIAKDATGRLIPKHLGIAIPVLGTIEAGPGWPSPAEEELIDPMTLDEYLMP